MGSCSTATRLAFGGEFVEDLKLFPGLLRRYLERETGGVSSWTGETRDETGRDWVSDRHEDNGDSRGRLLRRSRRRHGSDDDHVDLQVDQFLGELGQPLGLGLGPPGLDQDTPALHVSAVAERRAKCRERTIRVGDGGSGSEAEQADALNLPRRLCVGVERRDEEPKGKGGDQLGDDELHERRLLKRSRRRRGRRRRARHS